MFGQVFACLKPAVLEKVLMTDPSNFDDAAKAAERATSILQYIQDRAKNGNYKVNSSKFPTLDTSVSLSSG